MLTTEKKIQLVIGKRGSGKSVLTKYLIRDTKRLVVYDIMTEYAAGVTCDDTDRHYLEFWRQVYRGDFRIIYRPLKVKEEIAWLAEAIFALGDLTFVVEEIDSICTSFDMPEAMQAIIQRGRHKNIELIGVTPAPFGIHRDLTRQAKSIYIFKTNEPRDIQYLSRLLGEAIEAKLAALEQYQFIHWSDVSEKLRVGKLQDETIVYREDP